MKYKAIIIDDEKDARESLALRLENYFPDIEVSSCCASAKEGIKAIQEEKPHLVFLDIQMPDGNGFNVLDHFPNPDFETIFVTAYENYSLKAIKVSSLDYILKPINQDELVVAIEKFKNKIQERKHAIHVFSENEATSYKLLVPCSHGFDLINIKDIIYCQADRNYTIIKITNETEKLVSKTIKEFEKFLSKYNFLRTHNSYLVNFRHIKSYKKSQGGFLIMSNNDELSVSSAKKDKLFSFFNKI